MFGIGFLMRGFDCRIGEFESCPGCWYNSCHVVICTVGQVYLDVKQAGRAILHSIIEHCIS